MKFKKKYLSILTLLFPLLITIGFASWVIVYTIEFSTQFKDQPTARLYNMKETVVYNDNPQVPTPKQSLDSIGVTEDEITYQYRIHSDSIINNTKYTVGKPIDAGTYDVRIKIEGSTDGAYDGTCQVQFTIQKKKIKLDSNLIEINYGGLNGLDDKGASYDSIMQEIHIEYIMPKIKFKDENNNIISTLTQSSYLQVDSINNGVYYYGTPVAGLTTTNTLVGSTYLGEIKLNSTYAPNYEFIQTETANGKVAGNKIYIKYKTVNIGTGTDYFTIEDAITEVNNSSGTIVLKGDNSSPSSYVNTCFTNIPLTDGNPYGTLNFSLNSGNKILVPYEASQTEYSTYTTGEGEDLFHSNFNVYSVLTIPSRVTLNLYGTMTVCAKLGYDQPSITFTMNRGVALVNGTLNVYNGATLKSYGYIKGNGTINLESGSKTTDVIRGYDFPGGNTASNILSTTFPMNLWSVNNISCKTYIKNGARYYGHVYINTSAASANGQYLLIGTTSSDDKNCIFKSSSSSSKYILKYATNPNTPNLSNFDYNGLTDITGCNQIAGQRTVFEINGTYSDQTFKITASAFGILPVNFATSKDVSLTFSFTDIIVKNGSNLSLTNSDYVFLPGSKCLVENGAKVSVGDGVDISVATYDLVKNKSSDGIHIYMYTTYCVDNVDAKFVINGQLTVSGKVGGKITATSTGGIINFTPETAQTTSSFHSLKAAYGSSDGAKVDQMRYYSEPIQAIGNINHTDNSNFVQGNYYVCVASGSGYSWSISENIKEFNIHFMDIDENGEIYELETVSLAVSATSNFIFTGTEYSAVKNFYIFDKWLDENGNSMLNKEFAGDINKITEIYVYATWIATNYNFQYFYYLPNGDSYDLIENNDSLDLTDVYEQSFTYDQLLSSNLSILAKPMYNEKFFKGWYIGTEIVDERLINKTLTKDIFIALFLEYGYGLENTTIPISCQFVDTINLTINFNHNIPDNDVGKIDSIVNPTNSTPIVLEAFDEEYRADTYDKIVKFNYWTIDDKIILQDEKNENLRSINLPYLLELVENYNAEHDDKIDLDIGTININGNVTQKCKFEYVERAYDDVEGTPTYKYVLPGETYDYSLLYNDSLKNHPLSSNIIEEIKLTGKNDISNHSIKIDSSDLTIGVKVAFKYYKKIKISFSLTNVASYSVKLDKYLNDDLTELIKEEKTFTYTEATDIYTIEGVKVWVSAIFNPSDYVDDGSDPALNTELELSENTTFTIKGKNSCIISGTLITLADGSKKKIEDITFDDYILVFNHETGQLDVTKMLFISHNNQECADYEILELKFNNGNNLRIVQEHVLFDLTLNEYVVINKNNVSNYIGHKFFTNELINGVFVSNCITLDSYDTYIDNVKIYCPVTAFHMNCFANDLLIMPSMPNSVNGLFNIFELDGDMKYNTELKEADIAKYGIFSYEEFNEFIGYQISYEAYLASPAIYLKVSLGKGLITQEEIIMIIEYLLSGSLIT